MRPATRALAAYVAGEPGFSASRDARGTLKCGDEHPTHGRQLNGTCRIAAGNCMRLQRCPRQTKTYGCEGETIKEAVCQAVVLVKAHNWERRGLKSRIEPAITQRPVSEGLRGVAASASGGAKETTKRSGSQHCLTGTLREPSLGDGLPESLRDPMSGSPPSPHGSHIACPVTLFRGIIFDPH